MYNSKLKSNSFIEKLSFSEVDKINGGDCRNEMINAAITIGVASVIFGPAGFIVSAVIAGGSAHGYCNNSNR